MVAASAGVIRAWCSLADVRPKQSLDLARLLRLVVRNQLHCAEDCLEIVDPRTMTRLLRMGGIPLARRSRRPLSVGEFLDRQTFVQSESCLRALRTVLEQGTRLPGAHEGVRAMATMQKIARSVSVGILALTLVSAAPSAQAQSAAFDPSGPWQGPCLGKDRSDRTLLVTFTRAERAWQAKGRLQTPGYPETDSTFEEVKVDGEKVSFISLFGPMLAEFTGARKGDRLDGSVTISRDGKAYMTCAWSLSRVAAK